MVYILVHTLHENGFSDFVDFFGDPFYRNILWVTLRVSLVSTAISLVLGYPTAFLHGPDQVPYEAGHDDCDPVSRFWSAPWSVPTAGWSFWAPTAF